MLSTVDMEAVAVLQKLGVKRVVIRDVTVVEIEFFPPPMLAIANDRKAVDALTNAADGVKSPERRALEQQLSVCDNPEEAAALKLKLKKLEMDALTFYSSDG
jgi:hypothetical protein